MKVLGNIPENVTYIYSSTKKLESFWDNDFLRAGWVGQEVTPAFCSDSTNAKTLETGRHWANGWWNRDKKPVQEVSRKNNPIEGIKIISLEKRSEGGRAYKVVTTDNFYFDLREDILMDTMLNAGIDAGGILKGTYIWARVGSEMKLVRVGSDLHNSLIENTQDRKLAKIKNSDLKVGHVYVGKDKINHVFLGFVDYFDCDYERTGNIFSYNYTITPTSRKFVTKSLLFYKVDRDNEIDLSHTWCIKISKNHSYIKEVGSIKVPENAIDSLREEAMKSVSEDIPRENIQYYQLDERGIIQNIAGMSPKLTMRESGKPLEIPEKFWKYLQRFPEA